MMNSSRPASGRNLLCCFVLVLSLALFPGNDAGAITDEGADIFEQSKKSVFQIRVIDLASDEKSTTGSGFYISPQGHMITNYHVVSEYVMKPDRYSIKFINEDGTSGDLSLLGIDVIHDLAILTTGQETDFFLRLGNSQIFKGERIFSMGNPHDLGMSIIEGTFNGLMEKSMYRKILFSASLNPGMSGGPALNRNGEVVGINVSTMGNDVSFLVPVEFLTALYHDVKAQVASPVAEWESIIEKQLLSQQDQFIADLLASEWEHLTLGDMFIPGEIAVPIKCWGNSMDKEKELMVKVRTSCSSEDSVYLNHEVYTAYYSFWFLHHTSKGMNTFRFYNHLVDDYVGAFSYYDEDDEFFTKFQCRNDFVKIAGRNWKAALCVRKYKKFQQLFDLNLVMSTVDEFDNGLMGAFVVRGVGKKAGQALIRRFMEEIQCQK